ncbi:hypothetical protein F0M17_13505 [Glutamicibacter sp. ZJUTW]|nr:hypothetical protein F0M17_13505 [Glutamicibacter sp. ZJUTW]
MFEDNCVGCRTLLGLLRARGVNLDTGKPLTSRERII